MPYQNRVTPYGDLVAVNSRGTLMGNRGCIHDAQGNLKSKKWARKEWVTCLLDFNERKRKIMSPGKYTELFFLDEATALASGHRPCATCRRSNYNLFKSLWFKANTDKLNGLSESINTLDNMLHSERMNHDGSKKKWKARISELPDGTMVTLADFEGAYLIKNGRLLKWTFDGYSPTEKYTNDEVVGVLTPPSIVRVILKGYEVDCHEVLGSDSLDLTY